MVPLRVGLGCDTHRLVRGGPLRIGGVEIPHNRSLAGHSDADVLLHAVTDALLGAAGLPDIGHLFPDTDPANRGRDSCEMLATAYQQVQQLGWQVNNLDCVVYCQRPKLAPFREAIRQQIAQTLGIPKETVNVKAKTAEQLGPVGREEMIEAQCVVLLVRGNRGPGSQPA